MSGTTSTIPTLTANLAVFAVDNGIPGYVPFTITVTPDEGVAPVLSGGQSGGTAIATATLNPTDTAGTYTGTISAIQGQAGGTIFDVTVQGTEIAEIDVNIAVVSENGTFSLGTVVPPSLPPATPATPAAPAA